MEKYIFTQKELLTNYGYKNNYSIDQNGIITDETTGHIIPYTKANDILLLLDTGQKQRITKKQLYRNIYKKEFSIDTIEDLPGEQWREIENTNGLFFISSCGRVKSYCHYKARLLKPYKKDRYLTVRILGKNKKIHRLVARAFVNNPDKQKYTTVHHIDGNRYNNNKDNLQWCSLYDNIKEYYKSIGIEI